MGSRGREGGGSRSVPNRGHHPPPPGRGPGHITAACQHVFGGQAARGPLTLLLQKIVLRRGQPTHATCVWLSTVLHAALPSLAPTPAGWEDAAARQPHSPAATLPPCTVVVHHMLCVSVRCGPAARAYARQMALGPMHLGWPDGGGGWLVVACAHGKPWACWSFHGRMLHAGSQAVRQAGAGQARCLPCRGPECIGLDTSTRARSHPHHHANSPPSSVEGGFGLGLALPCG